MQGAPGGAFTLLASSMFHNFWPAPAEQRFVQQLLFSKNIAVIGGPAEAGDDGFRSLLNRLGVAAGLEREELGRTDVM